MRFLVSALIIACLFGAALQAQSVADVARRERARRAEQTAGGRVYAAAPEGAWSRISMPAVVPPEAEVDGVEAGLEENGPPAVSGVPSGSVEEGSPPDPNQELLAQVAEYRGIVQELEDLRVRELLEVNRLRGIYLAPTTSQSALRQVQVELDDAQSRLFEAENELAEAREVLDRLETSLEQLVPLGS